MNTTTWSLAVDSLHRAKPFVKWAGGKTRLLPLLLPLFPKKIATYYEPFVGGGAVFFALSSEEPRRFDCACLGDSNADLVALYRAVQSQPEVVIRESDLPNTEEQFKEIRALKTYEWSEVARGSRLLYLNKTCFNGLWRTNQKGQFNVPFGHYKNPTIVNPIGIRSASRALRGVRVEHKDFAELLQEIQPGDFAYLDPPYAPLSKTSSFTAFGPDGFGKKEQTRLVEALKCLRARGGSALLSNSDTLETRELYKDFDVRSIEAPRSIAANGTRKSAPELIVTVNL